MTKSFHNCNGCRKHLLGKDTCSKGMDSLERAIEDTQEKIEEFDRVISGLNDQELGIFADEALSAFLNARGRYKATLVVLKKRLEKERGGCSGKCSGGTCDRFTV